MAFSAPVAENSNLSFSALDSAQSVDQVELVNAASYKDTENPLLILKGTASLSRINQYIEFAWETKNIKYPVSLQITSQNNVPALVSFNDPTLPISFIFPGQDEYLIDFFSSSDNKPFATVKVNIHEQHWEAKPVSGTASYRIDESLKYYPKTKLLAVRDSSKLFGVMIDPTGNGAKFSYPMKESK